MSPKLTFDLDGDGLPMRLDIFVRREVPDLSRSEAQRLIRAGAASVNGCVVDNPSTRVASSDLVEFAAPGPELPDAPPMPEQIDFDVVYDDDHLIVVDKPAGMVVHSGAGRKDGTLVNGLLARYPELAQLEPSERPGIVHRLDADTSGLMVVARTADAGSALSDAIKAREVDRRYTAMVVGKFPHRPGVIDRPIGRHPTIRTRQAIVKGGRPARTRFAFRAGFHAFGKALSMVDLKLETGRTHQIRVHLQAVGYPILGDPVYGIVLRELPLCRQFLHAHRLSFRHPTTGKELAFTSPLPPDLTQVQVRIGPPSSTVFTYAGDSTSAGLSAY
jgi:23S rRNA pseudouridine1911/1915/1917 synthase